MIPVEYLRALTAQFRPMAWSVERPTETTTGDGTSRTWASVASGTTGCRISTRSATGQERSGPSEAIQAVGQRVVWLPADTDVTPKDRIVADGRTFEVLDVHDRTYEIEREVICREIY